MFMTRPFLIGKSAGGGDASASNDAGDAVARSARPQTPSPVEQAIVAVDFRNSRRDGVFMRTLEGLAKFDDSPRILSQLEEQRKLPHTTNENNKRKLNAAYSSQSSRPTSRWTSASLPM